MSNGASNRSFNSDVDPQAFDRTFAESDGGLAAEAERRVVLEHECEYCGRKMKYADQQCGCTARRPGIH